MQALRDYAAGYEIDLQPDMLARFEQYMQLLLEWNRNINLTAITLPEEIVVKHFLDSLLLLRAVTLAPGAALVDIGTGAGFPGVPLKIVRADLDLVLVDSLRKRVNFLEQLSAELGQPNRCVHGRAEDLGRMREYRERFDCSSARAVASLPVLAEYCLPFVRVGGCFVALKGYEVEEEIAAAEQAVRRLGGEVEAIRKFALPQQNRRAMVVIRKISQTPPQYPRSAAKMTKSPL